MCCTTRSRTSRPTFSFGNQRDRLASPVSSLSTGLPPGAGGVRVRPVVGSDAWRVAARTCARNTRELRLQRRVEPRPLGKEGRRGVARQLLKVLGVDLVGCGRAIAIESHDDCLWVDDIQRQQQQQGGQSSGADEPPSPAEHAGQVRRQQDVYDRDPARKYVAVKAKHRKAIGTLV